MFQMEASPTGKLGPVQLRVMMSREPTSTDDTAINQHQVKPTYG